MKKKEMTQKQFQEAERKMNDLLAIATQKGGFEHLSAKESKELDEYTQLVNEYEKIHYSIPFPETLQGLIELKIYENKLKQKDLAKMLNITDTKLSEIIHKKRKPSVSFLKALHKVLGIDGNILLELA
jgi:HTH-type transcriptional regulator/antitoxin HigA